MSHCEREGNAVKFRVELVWKEDEQNAAESIYLTSDGRLILQGAAVSTADRQAMGMFGNQFPLFHRAEIAARCMPSTAASISSSLL